MKNMYHQKNSYLWNSSKGAIFEENKANRFVGPAVSIVAS